MKKNPRWQQEELQLALELYLSHDNGWLSRISDTSPEIVALSQILNGLDVVNGEKDSSFRSVGSIRMKLANFKALDPRYGKSSLSNGSKLDKETWEQYCEKYDLLRSQCIKCIKSRFHGKITKEIQDYFFRLTGNTPNDVSITTLKESQKTIDNIKNSAEKAGLSDVVDKSLQLEKAIEKALALYWQPYQEHAGINQRRTKAVNKPNKQTEKNASNDADNCLKIGKSVQQLVNHLIRYKLITESVLADVLSPVWCSDNLHMNHPLLKQLDPNADLHPQTIDSKGYSRYYHESYTIDGNDYLLCKELYERQRKHFNAWERSLKLNISKDLFVSILESIKKNDETSAFSITLQELKEHYERLVNIDKVITFLVKHHVLASYQGSLREYVVDDYEVLYLMIQSPKEYLCEGD